MKEFKFLEMEEMVSINGGCALCDLIDAIAECLKEALH